MKDFGSMGSLGGSVGRGWLLSIAGRLWGMRWVVMTAGGGGILDGDESFFWHDLMMCVWEMYG